MPTVDTLIERNATFAAERFAPLPPIPASRTLVVTCADARVDPAYTLGLDLGQAGVLRNVGGRITPAAIQMLAMLAGVAATEGTDAGWELILLHHTDCGITRLAQFPDLIAQYFEISLDEVPGKQVMDPRLAVAADIATLAANPAMPSALVVAGLVYDVTDGHVTTVVKPAPLRRTSPSSPVAARP